MNRQDAPTQAEFHETISTRSDRWYSACLKITRNRDLAEDAVQDAFIKLWANAGKFDPNTAKFTTWFYRIVLNQCLDRKRKKKPVSLPEGFDAIDDRDSPADT